MESEPCHKEWLFSIVLPNTLFTTTAITLLFLQIWKWKNELKLNKLLMHFQTVFTWLKWCFQITCVLNKGRIPFGSDVELTSRSCECHAALIKGICGVSNVGGESSRRGRATQEVILFELLSSACLMDNSDALTTKKKSSEWKLHTLHCQRKMWG